MRWVRRILLLVLLVALPVGVHLFVTRNSEAVSLDFLVVRFEGVAVWIVLLSAFCAGALLTALVALVRGAGLRLETWRFRKLTRDLESEVHQLRNLPLASDAPQARNLPLAPDAPQARNLPLASDAPQANEAGGERAELAALERGS